MVFKVEDGTGLSDATSYSSVADATTYFTSTGRDSAWGALTEGAQQKALEVGSSYADLRWGSRLAGRPLKQDQGMEFPRTGLVDRYGRAVLGLPRDWVHAACEYALQSLSGSLLPTSDSTAASETKRKKIVVGPITTETEYFSEVNTAGFKSYPLGDLLVKKYLLGGGAGGTGRVMRN